ncbi:MAG: NUDIX domain-containing protein [Candidatus Micrarchaeota archaeon]|nr:NUDIX domain-containing protein [Candidatus Micrarchaeota archaeon]
MAEMKNMESRIAVKSFIVNNRQELLLLKRSDDDPHAPGVWEVPGGRLDIGENPFEGLKREIREEANVDIEIMNPLRIHHFTRDDMQKITMITFLCKPLSADVSISKEHTDFSWKHLENAEREIVPSFMEDVKIIRKYFIK